MEGRKKPFTEFERSFLINLIQQNSAIIENKKNDGVTSQKKMAAWARIMEDYNTSTRITHKVDIKQLKKFWNNLKMKAREAKTRENLEHTLILSAVPKLPVIKITDSDAVNGQEHDDDCEHWTRVKSRKIPKSEVSYEIQEPQEADTQDMNILVKEQILSEPVFENPMLPRVSSGSKRRRLLSSECSTEFLENPVLVETQNNAKLLSSGCATDSPSIENYKLKIMEQDLKQRAKKFDIEMEHIKKIQEIEINLKKKEADHKAKMFELIEEEMIQKIKILKSNKNINE